MLERYTSRSAVRTSAGAALLVRRLHSLLATSDRYALGDEIARGGMGVVYRATDVILGREVAVKVLQEKFGPASGAAHRFADEARIAAQLQHPGIPPVHDLGHLADGRPFLAMKLIKGQTLDQLLSNRSDVSVDRGQFVAAFEKVCQALAYSHSHKVIHRDVKPANVMVGSFGEVQVMDWGLAKVLGSRPADGVNSEETATATAIHSLRDSDGSFTQAGSVLGTPAFMPPEQALGAINKIDARSDVFGLGAILAVILTGKPPFAASSAETTRIQAAQGNVDECFARLVDCGADPELVALCKWCLSPKPADRPADAGTVAKAVAELRAAADERARQAELDRVKAEGERATAEVRAAEEAKTRRLAEEKSTEQKKRRRVQLLLAAAVGVLLLAGVAAAWWRADQARVAQDRLGRNAVAVGTLIDQCEEALRADDAAKAAVSLEAAQKRAAEGGAEALASRLDRIGADLAVLADLDAVDQFRWTPVGSSLSDDVSVSGSIHPSASRKRAVLTATSGIRVQDAAVGTSLPDAAVVADRFRDALRRFGADPDTVPPETAAARVSQSVVRDRLVAALDRVLRAQKSAGVRAALREIDPDPYRDAVRDTVMANDWAKMVELAGRPAALEQRPGFAAFLGDSPAIGLERRRQLLGAAALRRPGDLGLLMGLGNTYPVDRQEGADDRLRWFQAAVAAAPWSSVAHNGLGIALKDKEDLDGAIAEYKEAIRLDPKNVHAHNNLGYSLRQKGDLGGSIDECKEAIRLDPNYAFAHGNLGWALSQSRDHRGAAACYAEVVRLEPNSVKFRREQGWILQAGGDLDGAIAAFKEVLRLDPKDGVAHNDLGNALDDKGDRDRAIAEYKEAIRLDPKYVHAHYNLGVTLDDNGDRDGAIAEYKEAIRLDPKYIDAHYCLGVALNENGDLVGAIAAYKETLRLDPSHVDARHDLPTAEKMQMLLPRLPDILAGRTAPDSPAEACVLADLCSRPFQKRYAAAVRLFEQAFADDAKLADNLTAGNRYDAACCAAQAARGDGVDAPASPAERAALRRKALAWLRADLALRKKQAASSSADERRAAADMQQWLKDSDLSALRSDAPRHEMTREERANWDALWADVKATIAEAQKPHPPMPDARRLDRAVQGQAVTWVRICHPFCPVTL